MENEKNESIGKGLLQITVHVLWRIFRGTICVFSKLREVKPSFHQSQCGFKLYKDFQGIEVVSISHHARTFQFHIIDMNLMFIIMIFVSI